MERASLRRGVLLAAAAVLAALGALAAWSLLGTSGGMAGGALAGAGAEAPDGARVRVEVLNATRTRGLARHAMLHLRDRGFDVVGLGNAPEPLDSTLVLDRSGNPEWAQAVAKALGGARVESRPDSSRYLDVTVLLGASWRAPAETFHP